MVRAVIFDIDGTLIDTVDFHASSWVRAFQHFGVKADFADVRQQIGKGADRLMPLFLPTGTSESRKKDIEQYRAALFKREYLPRAAPSLREILSEYHWVLLRPP